MTEEEKALKRKKKRKKKKRKKKHYLLKFLLLIALGVGLYYFLTSEVFDIQKIEVKNISHYTEEQVVDLSKIKKGTNLFETSMSDARDRLMTDPYMKDTKIERKLPGTVVITVKERVEYAAVPYGTEYILIDDEAVVLSRTSAEPRLPLLMGMTVKSMEPGSTLEVEENNVLDETLKLLAAMEEGDLYFKKIEISNVLIKAYIYDYLICEGKPKNILNGMDDIRKVIYNMYENGIERGVIKVNSSDMWAWSPLIE